MPKYVTYGSIYYDCYLDNEEFSYRVADGDTHLSIVGKQIEIELIAESSEKAKHLAKRLSESVCKWLTLLTNVLITANITSVKNEAGQISVELRVDGERAVLLERRGLETSLKGIENNFSKVVNPRTEVDLALEYVSLGNSLLNSRIPYRHRYAILEYSRAVEIILGFQYKKEECEEELLNRGWDYLVADVLWLLNIRGGQDVAHPSKKLHATEEDAFRARDIARQIVIEETGFLSLVE